MTGRAGPPAEGRAGLHRSLLYAVETAQVTVLLGGPEHEDLCGNGVAEVLKRGGWCQRGYSIAIAATSGLSPPAPGTLAAAEPLQRTLRRMSEEELLVEALSDPILSRYSAVLLPDAFRRSASADLLMALLKKLCGLRQQLRVVLTADTEIAAEALRTFFHSQTLRVVALGPPAHRTDVLHLSQAAGDRVEAAAALVARLHDKEEGAGRDIVVVLACLREVRKAASILREGRHQGLSLLSQSHDGSFEADGAARRGHRRCVLCSAHGARDAVRLLSARAAPLLVVDGGFERLAFFDGGVKRLRTVPISAAAAEARRALAGASGKVFRLYPTSALEGLRAEPHHELGRCDLCTCALRIFCLGLDPVHVDLPAPPAPEALADALCVLVGNGALERTGQGTSQRWAPTDAGRRMASLPVGARPAAALIAAAERGDAFAAAMATVVAMAGVAGRGLHRGKEPAAAFEGLASGLGDAVSLLRLFEEWEGTPRGRARDEWCAERGIAGGRMMAAKRSRRRILRALGRSGYPGASAAGAVLAPGEEEGLVRCLVRGFVDRVARLRSDGRYAVLGAGGRPQVVELDRRSVLYSFGSPPEFVLFWEAEDNGDGDAVRIRVVSALHPRWAVEEAPAYFEERGMDAATGAVNLG